MNPETEDTETGDSEESDGFDVPDGDLSCYFGDTGTGKSYLARQHVLQAVAGFPAALGVYLTPNGKARDPWPGPVVLPGTDLAKAPQFVSYRGGSVYEGACEDVLRVCGDVERGIPPQRCVYFLIDESHRIFDHMPSDGPAADLFHESRHRGIHLRVISQWPARVDKILFRRADTLYLFRVHAFEDKEWFRRRWGKQAGNDLASLPDRVYRMIAGGRLPPQWNPPEAEPERDENEQGTYLDAGNRGRGRDSSRRGFQRSAEEGVGVGGPGVEPETED